MTPHRSTKIRARLAGSDTEYSLHEGLKQVNQIDKSWRSPEQGEQVADLLTYHFKNALDIAHRLVEQEEHQEVILDVIDRLPIGVIVVDKDRHILQANSNAQRYIEKSREIVLKDGLLEATNRDLDARLNRIVKDLSRRAPTAESGNMEMISVPGDLSEKLLLFLMPARGGLTTDGFSNIIIFLSHPKSLPIGIPREIQQLFDLTNRESEVLCSLTRGYTVKEIAERDSVSEATVRTQLKSLFTKTKTTRQVDLVKLVLSIPSGSPQPGNTIARTLLAGANHDSVSVGKDDAVQFVTLPDNRRLSYQEYGQPDGIPLFYLHSILGSHLEIRNIAHRACVEQGVRLIAPNRPGFSHSDPAPNHTLLDWADDLGALADHLGLDQFYVAGQTMGGPYACAAATKLKDRVKKLLIISSGVVPHTREEFAQQILLYRFAQRLARDFPSGYRLLYNLMFKGILKNRKKFLKNLAQDLVPEEAQLFKSESFCTQLFDGLREGYKQGGYHTARDVMLVMSDWGFALGKIDVPAQIWHGTEDRHVPCILSKKLADQLPDSELITVPGAGHFMAYRNFDQILERFLAGPDP